MRKGLEGNGAKLGPSGSLIRQVRHASISPAASTQMPPLRAGVCPVRCMILHATLGPVRQCTRPSTANRQGRRTRQGREAMRRKRREAKGRDTRDTRDTREGNANKYHEYSKLFHSVWPGGGSSVLSVLHTNACTVQSMYIHPEHQHCQPSCSHQHGTRGRKRRKITIKIKIKILPYKSTKEKVCSFAPGLQPWEHGNGEET